jgi:hypothetical protein
MIETGAYGERMAGYLHLTEPPIHARLGFGRSKLAVSRLHAPNGFTDPTSPIPLEKARQDLRSAIPTCSLYWIALPCTRPFL